MTYESDLEREREKRDLILQSMRARTPVYQEPTPFLDIDLMHRDLRSWAIINLVFGVLSVFSGGALNPVWGIVMIMIAILAWRVKLPATFVFLGVTMAWVAVKNGIGVLSGGNIMWLGLSLLQAYWAYTLLRRWKLYSRSSLDQLYESGQWPAHLAPPPKEPVVTGRFAIAGLMMGAVALILVPGVCMTAIVLMMVNQGPTTPLWLVWLIEGSVDVGVMALGLSLAALLSKNDKKGWAIGGTIVGGLVLVVWLVIMLLGSSG